MPENIFQVESLAQPIIDWTLDRELNEQPATTFRVDVEECVCPFDWLPWAIAAGFLAYGMTKR